jgi:orotate phosphoribosyltransferase
VNGDEILSYLAEYDAVLTGSHYIYTKGGHGTAYINMRAVASHSYWLSKVAQELVYRLRRYQYDILVGPETLGRTLAEYGGLWTREGKAVWCDMTGEGEMKQASFSKKLGFDRLVKGRQVAIVDDLLTTGSSIKAVSELVTASGSEVVAAAAVVRRTPDVTAEDCGVPALEFLADVPGFVLFSPDECAEWGPCSERVPVVLLPGHGHEWIKNHPDYPTV